MTTQSTLAHKEMWNVVLLKQMKHDDEALGVMFPAKAISHTLLCDTVFPVLKIIEGRY